VDLSGLCTGRGPEGLFATNPDRHIYIFMYINRIDKNIHHDRYDDVQSCWIGHLFLISLVSR
jgi:hypothetical protein